MKTANNTFARVLTPITLQIAAFLLASIANAQTTTVAGTTPGQFSVNESGAATYRIPIQAPPGVAGMEPKLELSYNSQGGNGLLGVGWSLGGLSAISRCPRTMAVDGVRGGVNYDMNDRYCMDGQRLILVSGTYGVAGSEYRTELDSFSKIVASGTAGNGVASFTVQTKAGLTMEYGNTADSRIEAQGKATVRAWAVNKISDVKTNYLTFSYTVDHSNGEYYLARVDYAGNTTSGTAPINQVRFNYEARPDVLVRYRSGSKIRNTLRLASVQTYAALSLVKNYALSYDNLAAVGSTRVTGIQECDGTGACIQPTLFSWSTDIGGVDAAVVATDINGNGWTSSAYPRRFADVNGDGLPDLVLIDKDEAVPHVFLGKGDGSFLPQPVSTDVNGSGWTESAYARYLMDVNGDGRADLVLAANSEAQVYVFLGQANGSFSQQAISTDVDGSGWTSSAYPRRFADVNGDGLPDLVLIGKDEAVPHVFLGKGDGSFLAQSVSTDVNGNGWTELAYPRNLVDINGDGRADLVMTLTSEALTYVFLGQADGSFAQQAISTDINGNGWTLSAYSREFADVNGDGKNDLILAMEGEALMHVSLSRFPASLLQSVSRGPENMAIFTYKSLADSTFYTKDGPPNASAYPKLDMQYAQQVVSTVASNNGIGGTITTQYNYGGLKAEVGTGRGMLGFRWMKSKNLANNIESYTEFNQNWPFTGSVAKSETRLAGSGNSGVLKRTTNTYSQGTGSAAGTTFVYPSQSMEESWDLGGSPYPTVTNAYQYGQSPQYGDPTQISVSNSAGAGKTTANEYWPANTASGSWVLGRLKKAAVTSVTP